MGDVSTESKHYERPSVTADTVVFSYAGRKLQVLLIRRKYEPFANAWALPGGFVNIDEALETAAARELHEETGLKDAYLEQLYTFGDPGRDPRGRVITVAHLAVVRPDSIPLIRSGDDAGDAAWFGIDDLPDLAFDHHLIIDYALQRLRHNIRYTPLGFLLLPKEFSLSELQQLYETILEETLDKRNFRRKILMQGILEDTGNLRYGDHRPARLYRYATARAELETTCRRLP